ncbi:hypothetical protein INR49_016006 [Caranx melampygus]|nr:hypothetical protein INR49_016006 [Caranx melampygus]
MHVFIYNMAGVWCFTQFLLLWFAALSPAAESEFIQVPEDNRPAGIFLLIEEGNYTLNFTAAKDACQSLDSTIATREQVQQALNQGLETCKYGWIAEAVAVVPRLKPDKKCGASKTGVVTWSARLDTEFGVFCFDASDSQKTLHTLTAAPPTPATVMTTTPANCYAHFLNSFTSCFFC